MKRLGLLLLFTLAASGCGSESAEGPTDPTPSGVIDISELADQNPPLSATVRGSVFWDDDAARLCGVLMESFPPQCGDPSIVIGNPELLEVEFTETQGIRWTDRVVEIEGNWDGEVFTLDADGS